MEQTEINGTNERILIWIFSVSSVYFRLFRYLFIPFPQNPIVRKEI
jgi:hypothetical protein